MPMSNTGRRRRSTRSVAPSRTTSPSPSGRREPQPPSRLPQWKFSQVLGELPPAAEAHCDGAPRPQDDDGIYQLMSANSNLRASRRIFVGCWTDRCFRTRASADEISAVEFDGRGEYLAAGDNAGRVILFRMTDDDDGDGVSVPALPVLIRTRLLRPRGD